MRTTVAYIVLDTIGTIVGGLVGFLLEAGSKSNTISRRIWARWSMSPGTTSLFSGDDHDTAGLAGGRRFRGCGLRGPGHGPDHQYLAQAFCS